MCPPSTPQGAADIALALDAVRASLLRQARSAADHVLQEARDEGTAGIERARAEAARLIEDARSAGRADAEDLLAAETAAARRRAREVVLHARRTAYDDVRRRAQDAVRDLLTEPEVRTAMTTSLRRRLPASAQVRDGSDGGLLLETADQHLDASVDALVDAALARMDLEELWLPTR